MPVLAIGYIAVSVTFVNENESEIKIKIKERNDMKKKLNLNKLHMFGNYLPGNPQNYHMYK